MVHYVYMCMPSSQNCERDDPHAIATIGESPWTSTSVGFLVVSLALNCARTWTVRIRTIAKLPIEVNLLNTAQGPIYQKIANKSLHLNELGFSNRKIASHLNVNKKTVAKSITWMVDQNSDFSNNWKGYYRYKVEQYWAGTARIPWQRVQSSFQSQNLAPQFQFRAMLSAQFENFRTKILLTHFQIREFCFPDFRRTTGLRPFITGHLNNAMWGNPLQSRFQIACVVQLFFDRGLVHDPVNTPSVIVCLVLGHTAAVRLNWRHNCWDRFWMEINSISQTTTTIGNNQRNLPRL